MADLTAKEWLSQARHINERIKALEESKRRAYERATSAVAPIRDGYVHNSTPGSKSEAYAILSKEVDRQVEELNKKKAEITKVIGHVGDNILATLLTEYYVNGKTWEEVAVCIGYCYQDTIQRKHPAALRKIDRILKLDKK